MNLELPFDVPGSSELDEYLARIDRELDALFLDEVDAVFEQLGALAADGPSADAAVA